MYICLRKGNGKTVRHLVSVGYYCTNKNRGNTTKNVVRNKKRLNGQLLNYNLITTKIRIISIINGIQK